MMPARLRALRLRALRLRALRLRALRVLGDPMPWLKWWMVCVRVVRGLGRGARALGAV